jgi:RNA polymerase sigma factor (sigma-70 family)
VGVDQYAELYLGESDALKVFIFRKIKGGKENPRDLNDIMDDAKGMTSETFARFLHKYEGLDDPEHQRKWLYTTAGNLIKDLWREQSGKTQRGHIGLYGKIDPKDKDRGSKQFIYKETVDRVAEATGTSQPLTPEEELNKTEEEQIQKDKIERGYQVLDSYKERERQIIKLKYLAEPPVTHKQIGAELGIKEGSLETTIWRVVKKFIRECQELEVAQ